MNYDDYIATLKSDAAAFVDVARTVDLDAQVPSCPEWTARDLVRHMGGHHRWVRGNLDRTPEDGMQPVGDYEPAPEGAGVADWVAAGAAALADRLGEVGSEQRCWTWVPEQSTSGFWARRTTNETAVHRWDLQNTAGIPTPIDAALAVDGIDEHLSIVRLGYLGGAPTGAGETVHLHATDAPGEWLIRLEADGMHVTSEHAKGDVAVRGPASDLLLVVHHRLPASTVDVFGDEQLLARWLEKTRF